MAILKIRDGDGNVVEIPAIKGTDGKSAYQYAVEKGYTGSESEFAESIYNAVNGTSNGQYFGTCNTASDIYEKVVVLDNAEGFELVDKAHITVRFTAGLKVKRDQISDITLNINNTGNKVLYLYGGVDASGAYTTTNVDTNIVGMSGILDLYYDAELDGYIIPGDWVSESATADFAWDAEEVQSVQCPQLFGTCNSDTDQAIKVIEVDSRFNNFLRDGTRLTIRFTYGLKALDCTSIYFNINGMEYPVFYNGTDDFGLFAGDSWLIWGNGVLSFIYQENDPDLGPRFVLDGGTDQLCFINDFTDAFKTQGYANPSELINDIDSKLDRTEADEIYIPFSGGSLDRGASLTLNSASDNRKTEYTWGGFKFYAPSGNAAWAATAGSYWDNAGTTNYGGVGAYGGPSGLQYYFFGAYNDAKLKVQLNGNTSCTGTFTPSKGMDASYLTWGNTASKNITGNTTIVDAPFIEGMSANRFAFKDPNTIIIEYSNDGGATWIDYGAADSSKQKLLTQSNAFYIGKLKATKSDAGRLATADDMLRVTIQKGSLYTNLKKLAIYVTTYGSSGCYVTIDQLLNGDTEYTTLVNKQSVSGWSGWNIINTIGNKTFGHTSTTGIAELRFTFGITTPPASTSAYSGALSINSIQGFGSIQYASDPNAGSLPKTGLIYSYDMNKDVTFPATITATDFLGNLTGIASAARMDEDGNNIIDTYATKDELTNYVPSGDWNTDNENADTYFGGYLNMKDLSDAVNYIQNGYLGRYKYYLGIDELADYSVPSAGWETSDMNHDWYFGGYADMKELANDVSYLSMGKWTVPNGREYYGVGDLFYAVSILEEWQETFYDSSDYQSISEISNEINDIKNEISSPTQAQSHILLTDTVTGEVYKVYMANGKLTAEVNK